MLINRAKKKTAEEADVASIAEVVSSTNMSMNRWYSSTCNKHLFQDSGTIEMRPRSRCWCRGRSWNVTGGGWWGGGWPLLGELGPGHQAEPPGGL